MPRLTASNERPYRAKSPKLSIGPEKYDTTRAMAESSTGIDAANDIGGPADRLREMFSQPASDTR